jgi:SAM-dependent methyltransferase
VRKFQTLEEFDEFNASVKDIGGTGEWISLLSNSYLADPSILDVPKDPFSEEYSEAVLRIYTRLSGRQKYDPYTCEQVPAKVEDYVKRPAAYRNDSRFLGDYLESYAHVIKQLDAKPGMRVLEYGPGDGQIALHLARLGCDVTVFDVEPVYIEIVTEQARRLGVPITALRGDFLDGAHLEPFDRIFFYQAFHHASRHQAALMHFRKMLKPDGLIVFGPEPVIDPEGPWKDVVPYPWGPRLDGLSLSAMRNVGCMELGFQEPYFFEALDRFGWTGEKHQSTTNGLVSSIVSRMKSLP